MKRINVLIVTLGHPEPDMKSLPSSLTAPYMAGIITKIVDKI